MRRKLIEVALPLEAINVASAREKSIRRGHPSLLHLWWARRPLAACRAVLFASLIDDPSSDPDHFPTEKAQEEERSRLFGIIEDLVKWENSNNDDVLDRARAEIVRSTGGSPPPVLDPFCGGGSIPLEAQRLGLTSHSSDLNPVAVLITKAMVDIPPRFVNRPPVHPDARDRLGATGSWRGATGLAQDVRRYGGWMRDQAEEQIGHLYPRVRLPEEHGGGEAPAIAWIWARTVTCPNPACGARMPLVRTFELSKKAGRATWILPTVDPVTRGVSFAIGGSSGRPPSGTVNRQGARCLVCRAPVPFEHIRAEGRAGRLGDQLMAIVASSARGRIYFAPNPEHEGLARKAKPRWLPEGELADWPGHINVYAYGLTHFRDLFTPRQLVALTTFSDLVGAAREFIHRDAIEAGMPDDGVSLQHGGVGASAYADAIATYLAFGVDRSCDYWSTITTWASSGEFIRDTFARQAIPMVWDFAEAYPLGESTGSWSGAYEWIAGVIEELPASAGSDVNQADAAALPITGAQYLVCTDPPYYDNIGYSDLADFFYVWLRHSVGALYPELFGTMLTPKTTELVATPYRFAGGRREAQRHFETGLAAAFKRLYGASRPDYPITVFYAFKQSENDDDRGDGITTTASTGWETMLEALLSAGLSINGTWPVRSERGGRSISIGANALASSIVLVCAARKSEAGMTTRRDFVTLLKGELPSALRLLQHGNIAPVDLAQAAIGPGMSVFSRFEKILEPDGSRMPVRAGLALINQALSEILAEQEGEFDPDTRWAISWYEQFGLSEGPYGQAEVLSKAKDVGIDGLVRSGMVQALRGKVRLVARDAYDVEWEAAAQTRVSIWELTQRVIRTLRTDGEAPAAELLGRVGGLADSARALAYQLYGIAEKKGWSDEGQAYNSLVIAWPTLLIQAEQAAAQFPQQSVLELG